MPFYQFTVVEGTPSARLKQEISEAMTRVHQEITGAPPHLMSCSFVELPADSLYEGGKPTTGPRLVATIRRRPEQVKRDLIMAVARAWTDITDEPIDSVVIFVVDIPGYQAFEGGEFLPEADEELALTGRY